jgi:hypothetical protein
MIRAMASADFVSRPAEAELVFSVPRARRFSAAAEIEGFRFNI